MRPPIHWLICRALLCGVLLTACWPAFAAVKRPRANIHALQQQKAAYRNKANIVRRNLAEKRIVINDTEKELSNAQSYLRDAREQYQLAIQRYKSAQLELKQAQEALQRARVKYAGTQQSAGHRLAAMYERGEAAYLEVLVSANDFSDMLRRSQLASLSMEQDSKALQTLHHDKDELSAYEQQVEAKAREVARAKDQSDLERVKCEGYQQDVADILERRKREARALEDELKALERESRIITDMLRRLASSPAGRKRAHWFFDIPAGALPLMIPPGRLSSPFGWRYHPLFKTRLFHTGVDIAAPAGTSIHAVGKGQVISARWHGGYGNAVIIDHGGGRTTLYGHMLSIGVTEGQMVSDREIIGRVGSTGNSTGPHVHFERRVNGAPVNPLPAYH